MDLAAAKLRARKAVHDTMAVAVEWSDGVTTLPEGGPDKTVLSARWGNRMVRSDALGSEYAEIFEGVDRLIFQRPQLDALGIVLKRTQTVRFPDYNVTFELDQRQEGDGPLNLYWTVTRA